MTVGEYLRSRRLGLHKTGRQVAREAGISAAYLSDLERGHRGTPCPCVLLRVCRALGEGCYPVAVEIAVREFAARYREIEEAG